MTFTGEGSNTVTNYWLENAATTNVTPTVAVTQGKGFYYENAYSANVNHFFTLLGKMFFTPYGKEFFTSLSKQIFTS